MVQVLNIILQEDIHPSLMVDANNKLRVNTDEDTIQIKTNGTIGLKLESQTFIQAIKTNETLTALSSRVDAETGSRYITYQNEHGETTEINFSALMNDIHINGGVLEGDVLVLTDTTGDQVRIDLSLFMTESEARSLIESMFTVALRNLSGQTVGYILPNGS